jgi:WD40 repeat protein
MPDLREVFQMSTQKVRPDRGFIERQEFRQRRRARNRKIAAYAMVAAIVAIALVAITEVRSTSSVPADTPPPTGDLGIFAPVAGRILYVNEGPDSGLGAADLNYERGHWALDPNGPSDTLDGPRVAQDIVSTLARLDLGEDALPPSAGCGDWVEPLGWSSDGTELLVTRWKHCVGTYHVLYADGTETRVSTPSGAGARAATISPDGSRVAFESEGLVVADINGGAGKLPLPARGAIDSMPLTFSPDGSQIAYFSRDAVWVVSAEGVDAHELVAVGPAIAQGADSITWSPAGDRIAIGMRDKDAIYTFAPDGSDFTKVISGGDSPFWSPDGSQIAYTIPTGLAIADADGSNVRMFGYAASGPWHPGESAAAAGPTTLARGEDVELFGNVGIGNQQLNINAVEENGKATGEFRITDNVIGVDCADTHTDGLVILGGAVTGGPDFAPGDLVALIIREGDPDSVALRANDTGAASCTGMLKAIPDHLLTDDTHFVDLEYGYDIQTG